MAHDSLRQLLGNTDDDDGGTDFESYLSRKAKEWTTPASQMQETVRETDRVEIDVDAAVESSANDSSSTEIDESPEERQLASATGVDEKTTKLTLHDHPIVGSYITESTEELRTYATDEEWKKVFSDSRLVAVTECSAEQIIERFHNLDRTVYLIRAQQQGLRLALEDVLATKTYAQREQLLELDRKERSKNLRRQKGKDEAKASRAKSSVAKAASSKGKSKGQKGADTFKMLGFDKVTTESNLKAQNLLDESTQAYVNKLFA